MVKKTVFAVDKWTACDNVLSWQNGMVTKDLTRLKTLLVETEVRLEEINIFPL